ncbi:hypothetical protein D3C75_398650 [compost metagenome]
MYDRYTKQRIPELLGIIHKKTYVFRNYHVSFHDKTQEGVVNGITLDIFGPKGISNWAQAAPTLLLFLFTSDSKSISSLASNWLFDTEISA